MKIFSGIRPSGKLHLGNYFGAISRWVKLQKGNDCVYSVVDLHAVTTDFEPENLQKIILDNTCDLLAAGIDPNKSTFFLQSLACEHTELMWLLNSMTPVGKLERMTQYKQKTKGEKSPKAGLLNYPVLQAADILLYDTDAVPIGEDQKQHLELARDLARKFNNKFGETFKEPESLISEKGARIMSLQKPASKMSKSEPAGCLFLSDSPAEIENKVKAAVTDSGTEVKFAPDKPALSNLLTIYSLFSEKEAAEIEKQFQNKGYEEFKNSLAEVITDGLAKHQDERKKLLSQPEKIKQILTDGAQKARKRAEKKIKEVKEKMGLITS